MSNNITRTEYQISEYHKNRYINMLPDNIFYDTCDGCEEIWYENIGSLKKCFCKNFRLCEICLTDGNGHYIDFCSDSDIDNNIDRNDN